MSAPHPLNQAVITQALHDIRHGQLRHCKAMGFGDQELAALKIPAKVSILINAVVPWCTVTVNREVVQRLLTQVHDIEIEIATIDRMLQLEASTEMISKHFGLTHQEVAVRREVLGLPKRKGRHRALTEEQEVALWHQWSPAVAAQSISLHDETGMLSIAMDLAETQALPMSVVWSAIRGWVEQALTQEAAPKRLRLSSAA